MTSQSFQNTADAPSDVEQLAALGPVFFHDTLMHSPMGVFVALPAGRIVFVNHALAQVMGYASSEECVAAVKNITVQLPHDAEERETIAQLFAQGDVVSNQECQVIKKDGSTAWLTGAVQHVRDLSGQMLCIRGYVTDMTRHHRRAEETLRQSEERFRALSRLLRLICDNVPDMIWAKDLNKKYIFANKAICSGLLSAVDVEEPIGKTDMFFAQRERTRYADNPAWHTFGEICRDTDQITMDAGCPQQFDEYGNVQGAFLFLDVHKAPLRDESGTMIGTVGSARDVTDYKRLEKTLREREEAFRTITLMTSDMVFSCDYDLERGFELVWVGGAVERITGYRPEELLEKKTFKPLVFPEDLSFFVRNVCELNSGGSASLEVRLMRKDASVLWVKCTVQCLNPDSDQTHRRIYGSLVDITAHKEAEDALREERIILRGILEDILAGYWDWDMDSAYKYLSPSLKHMFGYEDDELPNTYEAWLSLIVPEDVPMVHSALQAHIESMGRIAFNKEVRFRHKDGHIVWVICAGRVIRWSDGGQAVRMVGCHIDISQQKAVEDALVVAKKDADAASSAKSEFLANMSHELRTPLNGIMGILQLLETTELDQEQKGYVSMGLQSSDRLVGLLADILDLSRIEAGVMRVQHAPVHLDDLFGQIRDLFSSTALTKSIHFTMKIYPGIPAHLQGDSDRLHQILTNLIGNAFKFTPRGHVTVEACALPMRGTGVCQVLFSVSDSGIGVPDEKLPHLFQAFYQVNVGYKRAYQGAGLGLALCNRLISLMGGTMSVISEPDSGTTFYFTIPFDLSENE